MGSRMKALYWALMAACLVISYNDVTETKVTYSRLTPCTIYTSAGISLDGHSDRLRQGMIT
ncbi:hypothetical protein SSCH_290023 [Syntrophaceticus schinkii]|jgi:hypothetical protein|uniref:Uncharacterized protein n=1 Tax=Syntrophaceticus schinkii TaxID=499207 RepID=A0A0B7ML09_9FIRM|nr:hypothetical protein SSCH_290023 [Syntrophaceticus schinkii]